MIPRQIPPKKGKGNMVISSLRVGQLGNFNLSRCVRGFAQPACRIRSTGNSRRMAA